MGRGLAIAGALLIVGGGGALGFALTKSPTLSADLTPDQTRAMTSAIERLDSDIAVARTNAKTRVETFASTHKKLGNALVLGAEAKATVRDQVYDDKGGEGRLDLAPGEMLDIGYVAGDKWEHLVTQPESAKPSGIGGKPAIYTKLVDDNLMVIAVAEVKDEKGTVTGYATLGQPNPLKPAFDTLVAAGITGRFELGGEKREIGGTLPADAPTMNQPLRSEPAATIVIATPQKPVGGKSMALIGGGAGIAALGLLLIVIGMMTGKKQAVAAPPIDIRSMPTLPSGENAQTQISTSMPVAAGTPAPVDTGGAPIRPSSIGAGAMIGRWEVIRRLGSGGMADVYLAHSKGEAGFEKLVAIKVMHPHLARNERAVEHFLDEARLAARISHPNIVQILDLGKIGNDYVIVMEYVEGVDLERLLASARSAGRPVPVAVGLGVLCRICDGLHAAHTAVAADGTPLGIIHRDVKSANVLVSKQGSVKVVDFGIAKAATQSHLTAAGETKGTPSMMAPEQRVGERVDVRADVYSVAAVGYEVMTGRAVNLDLAGLAHLGVEKWPHLPPPTELRPELPAELDQLLLKTMAFERDHRPPDCATLEASFEAVMKKYGLTASDKDIARWVDSELRQLIPAFEGSMTSGMTKPATPSG